ncbi:MAG: GtrA family protein [Candidatus Aminicenantes bacterium]|nr:MAG: GtrA family protein [Candidatus Aminicenantes bacterium]
MRIYLKNMINKLLKSKNDKTLIQLFRYTFVGGAAFAVDFSALYILTDVLGIYYLVSAAVAFLLGLTTNYILCNIWVFSTRTLTNKWLEFGIFSLIGVIGLGMNEVIIWAFTEHIRFHYMASKVVSTVIVFSWNFFARKYILYNKKENKNKE